METQNILKIKNLQLVWQRMDGELIIYSWRKYFVYPRLYGIEL